jgi:NADH-quinone oxidoreductase subunit G
MATIHVDGKALEVDGADNLLQACLSLGLDIPYFCWHPALGSVGACRQCAVKQYTDENDTRGRIVMSCMTPATDNTWISIEDEESKAFRASVVEWLMTNHPHDCPVCEERAPLSLHQAYPPESGTRPVHRSRDEPLHRLLSLRALL